MPNKHRLSIDLAKVQGALWFTSPKTGEKCLVIVPSKARAKHYATKKEGQQDSLYLALEVVPLKNGPNDREDTHFITEPSTREEREDPNFTRMPILGNGREYDFGSKPAPRAVNPAPQQETAMVADEDDEIPF